MGRDRTQHQLSEYGPQLWDFEILRTVKWRIYLPYTLSGNTVGGATSAGTISSSNPTGTVNVYRVFTTVAADSKHPDDTSTWVTDNHIIASGGEVFVNNYAIPSGCGLIYSEAKTWIEGTIAGKVTIVAADEVSAPDGGAYAPTLFLPTTSPIRLPTAVSDSPPSRSVPSSYR